MVESAVVPSLGFAVAAGLATFFSPCAYPLLPGYVAFYVQRSEDERSIGGALARGLVAGGGVVVTLGALIAVAYWVGASVIHAVVWFEPLVGILLIAFGVLVVLDWGPSLSLAMPRRRSSIHGFGIFGAGFAAAATGCVAPIFLGLVAHAVSLPGAVAGSVLGVYMATVVLLMVSLTVATGVGLMAGASRLSAYTHRLEQLAGGVMILAGVGQLYVAATLI